MNRPEPRPLPKPLRVLCLFVAALLVCSLGVIVANHQPRFRDGRETGVHGQKENGFGPATVRRPGGGGNPGSRRLVSAHHRVPR